MNQASISRKINRIISKIKKILFNATVEKIIIGNDNVITFCLVGGLKVDEEV